MRHADSPCSVPTWLRPLVPVEDAAWQDACRIHDEDYSRGGSERDRMIADVRFLLNMLTRGVDEAWAMKYFQAVRVYGRTAFGTDYAIEWPDPWSNQAP